MVTPKVATTIRTAMIILWALSLFLLIQLFMVQVQCFRWILTIYLFRAERSNEWFWCFPVLVTHMLTCRLTILDGTRRGQTNQAFIDFQASWSTSVGTGCNFLTFLWFLLLSCTKYPPNSRQDLKGCDILSYEAIITSYVIRDGSLKSVFYTAILLFWKPFLYE